MIVFVSRIIYLVLKVINVKIGFISKSPFIPDFFDDYIIRPYLILIGFYLVICSLVIRLLKRLDSQAIYLKLLIAITIGWIFFVDPRILIFLYKITADVTTTVMG